MAVSRSLPFKFPVSGSLSILPPFGSGVSSSIPAILRANEFTYAVWPPLWNIITGWSGDTSSRSILFIYLFSFVLVSSYLNPLIHSPLGVFLDLSKIAFLISSIDLRSQSTFLRCDLPAPAGWEWASINPGVIIFHQH